MNTEALLETARAQQRLETLRSFVEWIAARECYCGSGRGHFDWREGDDRDGEIPCDVCRAKLVIVLTRGAP